ncbi:MAG: penicillin-binding protein 2 [Proteobacteria bacterium]|nr:penicillin-binding protein 2 [Pseudomonadota bacterium]
MGSLIGRLYYLQVIEAERYHTLAEENRISLRLLPPPRGRILDRQGNPLAINSRNYRALVVREEANDMPGTLDALGQIIPLSPGERQRVVREAMRRRSFVPVTVRENLGWREVAQIEVNAPDLPGVSIDVGQSRYYPHGELAAHVLGYVAAVSEAELTGDPVLELPGFRVGKSGIEKTYDPLLRGKAGNAQLEVNALGRIIRELSRQEGEAGSDVTLTLDVELQRFATQRFGGESGAAVVLDVHTGEILAMVSTPSFDPNAFNRGLSAEEWKGLSTNPMAPLINKATAGQYAPGSTFKMMVALAALEGGIVDPQQKFFCPGYLDLGNARFHCWKKQGHGWIDMYNGIVQSCDVYFYELARRVGIDRIAAMAQRFGLGEPVGIEIPGERAGLVPTRDWKRAATGVAWQPGETVVVGIGQGYILATPLQLATMIARLVNGGAAIVPRLTRRLGPERAALERPREGPRLGVTESSLRLVRTAMEGVVNSPRGTAYRARIAEKGMEMGGKTGTSQVRRITRAEREQGVKKNEQLPWEERDHALFVGFAPVSAPRYAAAVVVEHGGGGSAVAAPIARDLLIETQRRDPSRSRVIAGLGGERDAPRGGG